MAKIPNWLTEGYKHIWLPYTQMKTSPLPLPVKSAEGVRITLSDGTELIDGIASWWSACHGYQHPHIIRQMKNQLSSMPHMMFGGLANQPAYKLAKRLTKITPKGLTRVFFSDSGSVAVEVAMKIAAQYWSNRGDRHKHKFICFKHAYHGDTMGGMSLADPEEAMHKMMNDYMPKQCVMNLPMDEYSFAEFEEVVKGIKKMVAGIVIEPLVQAAGGMVFHSADILAAIYRICKNHDILFIADEVATGFGRTGNMFACDEAGISPDIMCVGKALTGGAIGMAATLASEEIFSTFLGDGENHTLMHGPTFMGNPLACAAANASLDLFEDEPRLKQVERIEAQLSAELEKCTVFSNVADVRVKGAIGVVELKNSSHAYLNKLRRAFVDEGIWLRPIGNIIYVMPAFVISEKDLRKITDTIYEVLMKA